MHTFIDSVMKSVDIFRSGMRSAAKLHGGLAHLRWAGAETGFSVDGAVLVMLILLSYILNLLI